MKTIALVGNPNTGKTTLFNSVLNADEHVGNWHGVTVDLKEKQFKQNGKQIATITDLPGTYSLSPFSFEEEVTRNYLFDAKNQNKDLLILNIVDGNCLERNLILTLELIELGLNPIVCINMANELKKKNIEINTKKLANQLGVNVFLTNAQDKKQVKSLFDKILKREENDKKQNIIHNKNELFSKNEIYKKNKSNSVDSKIVLDKTFEEKDSMNNDTDSHINKFTYIEMFSKKIESMFSGAINIFRNKTKIKNIDLAKQKNIFQKLSLFEKAKLFELDKKVWDSVSFDKNFKSELYDIIDKNDFTHEIIKFRFDYIKSLELCKTNNYIYGKSKIDKYVLNKYIAIPIFLLIVFAIFYLTFGPLGNFLTDTLSQFFERVLISPITTFIKSKSNNLFVVNFFVEAIFGSIGTIVSFLPQIVLMYLGLYFLEDSGYMSRLAFTFEDYLKYVGLSGKSIFTLLMCFGCSTTATLTSRNLENKNSKIKTALLTPYISCTAKLPIYSVICGAFFPNYKFLVVIGFYLIGIVVALVVSYFLNKTVLKSNDTNFILEMPPYRFPSTKKILKNVFSNSFLFIRWYLHG